MSAVTRKLGSFLLVIAATVAVHAGSAVAAPVWNLEMHHGPTHFAPGQTNEIWFTISNLGEDPVAEASKLEVELPPGLTLVSSRNSGWFCPTAPGATIVECELTEPIPAHRITIGSPFTPGFLALVVVPDSSLNGQTVSVRATIEGGGAPASITDVEPIEVSGAGSPFSIVSGSFKADFYDENGITPAREAGSHPALATFAFDFANNDFPTPSIPNFKAPSEAIRDIEVELPPGFVGNPSAVAECTLGQLAAYLCPRASQIGRIDVGAEAIGTLDENTWLGLQSLPVFNMAHSKGSVTDLAFNFSNNIVRIQASLNPANGYAIRTAVPAINQFLPLYFQKLTLWGVPGDGSHDVERCSLVSETPCPSEAVGAPFLTVPSQCGVAHEMKLRRYDSWEHPGVFGPELAYQIPGQTTDCDVPRFKPELTANPTGREANSPAGLDVRISVPQNQNANGLATPPVKRVKVVLPDGMTISPSFANGLAGCSEAQLGISHTGVPDGVPVGCPDNSRIGAVTLLTPLLPKPLEGSLYLAAQDANPFNSTFAIYLEIEDVEERGLLLKIPGRLDLDPATGQITTTFDNLPQFPFEQFTLSFRSGQRAPLINPPSCGTHAITAAIASYAQPTNDLNVASSYQVTQGANGTPCPTSLGARPFSPELSSGTLNPNAGSFSPFLFRLTRQDQEQEIGTVSTTLPDGLLAKIAGIPYCSESAIASISTAEGTGRSELARPACPAASRLGSVSTGVGAGNEPNYFPGSVYLAGAYKGAPLSLAIVVPALAGPYDLGSVVVRAGVFVDPQTAQVRVQSDPLPIIVHGVQLRVRDIRINVDRPETMLNPTSCDPMSVRTNIVSTGGAGASPANRFQVANCSRLPYAPKLAMSLSGATKRSGNPALRAVLTQPKNQANNRRISVVLPKHLFIDNAHINNPCTRPQFAAGNCPPNSVLGRARAFTPLLDEPLEGPVYFRSNGGDRELPDLVVALRGKFDVNLVGFIDSVSKKGSETSRVRTRFLSAPDAPVTKFVLSLKGGKQGLLENSVNLCKVKSRADVRMVAHSGKAKSASPLIANGCKQQGPKNRR